MPVSLDQAAAADARPIAIGCFASLCRDRLAEPLVTFSTACPDTGIGVHEMSYAELLPAVAARRLALAIRPGGAMPGFAGCDLWRDHAVVAVRRGHPFTAMPRVTPAMLEREVLLVSRDRARGALHRFLVERLFGDHAPASRIVADARRCQMLDRVAAGEGIALLCASQVDAALDQLDTRPIDGEAAHFGIRAYWLEPPEARLAALVTMLMATRDV